MASVVKSISVAAATGGTEGFEQSAGLERFALRISDWAERWYPDAFVFAIVGVVVVALGAVAAGAAPTAVAKSFGSGFWTLIPFTMQIGMGALLGFVVASSTPAAWLIRRLALYPSTGKGAVAYIALVTMLVSVVSWALSLIFSALLVRELARRVELKMDYRAAGASAYLGLGATWALGISSAAAQIQANPASLPKTLLSITGVIPFEQTIFLWQSMSMMLVLIIISVAIAYWSAPAEQRAVTAQDIGIDLSNPVQTLPKRERPGEWLEYSPILTVALAIMGFGWLVQEFAAKGFVLAISNLNTYNFLFFMIGLLLCWRPRRFIEAVAKATPSIAAILIQFPLYGAIAAMLVEPKGFGGVALADHIATVFVSISTQHLFPVTMGVYSAVLGFFVPSGGGKWLIEAPYVMAAANELKVHLGWAVQVYNAAEALPNLINPFWMLPLLGILKLRAKDLIGFTFTQFMVHAPIVLLMLWALGLTLTYQPPIVP
ncbi:TIGR00366 family protein [Methylobacterium sp.]|uniref:short-chain fatty acid transporter n=1 Tax=Methylobacterium sp. TaxID=409 RepID=UPI000C4D9EE5|nr:TIGR00366 family protein [Methylobacterium sp.]MBP32566.1 Short chain fatty acid transporter [Methylobacterium sp.]